MDWDKEKSERKAQGKVVIEKITKFMKFDIDTLEARKSEAQFGYLSMNLYNPPREATWGIYNDRKVSPGWVQKLSDMYRARIENCLADDAIEVAVKREWLKNDDKVSEEL